MRIESISQEAELHPTLTQAVRSLVDLRTPASSCLLLEDGGSTLYVKSSKGTRLMVDASLASAQSCVTDLILPTLVSLSRVYCQLWWTPAMIFLHAKIPVI